ncbi:type IVB secretion system protein IcmH/DotU [Polymorphobacter fuscus]|uniref:OmpA family protein n=1 Tax=Sandarakinorhabdus fusca TaxID=1439888 RepID=A0A7C9KKQ9_9SPHN|nr:type IVB secretion system protein IcmH/DotU [Polymorphobacter fuscus]KAB7648276.1 OmpA family protein [Polymorphobacter fuscus]MQT15784.1 OmpA family protein [Polymorphobacter fuscus]NJC07943.1 type VI secretion system protein ImpK [Polymorphobacter fuscus]
MAGEDEKGPRPARTVFRPSPLAAAGSPPPPIAVPPPPVGFTPPPPPQYAPATPPGQRRALPATDEVPPITEPMRVRNPIMAAASRFLAICAAVQAERQVSDAPTLIARAMTELKAFERTASGAGLTAEDLNRARYALAATLDDIVQNLPGGAAADWARQSVVVQSFGQAFGGDQFWGILDALLARPQANQDMLELFHACLAVGFIGRYRIGGDGPRQIQARMAAIHNALSGIRARPETDLVPAWRGVPTPTARTARWLVLLLVAGAALAALLIAFLALKFFLDARDETAWAKVRALPPAALTSIDRAGPGLAVASSTQLQRIRGRLTSTCIAADEDGGSVRLTISACQGLPGGMFDKGADQVAAAYAPLIIAAARALVPEAGPIDIVAHTDSDPIRSASFPDNLALSNARAANVAALLGGNGIDPARLNPAGRGDREPLDRADTADAKARNRRVELTIPRSN